MCSPCLRAGIPASRQLVEGDDLQDPIGDALAQLMKDVIVDDLDVRAKVKDFRSRFLDMRYCFSGDEFDPMVEKLSNLV